VPVHKACDGVFSPPALQQGAVHCHPLKLHDVVAARDKVHL
jgi:hypothetical protein